MWVRLPTQIQWQSSNRRSNETGKKNMSGKAAARDQAALAASREAGQASFRSPLSACSASLSSCLRQFVASSPRSHWYEHSFGRAEHRLRVCSEQSCGTHVRGSAQALFSLSDGGFHLAKKFLIGL
jgi:hypothetical protein